ncbi:MAG: hypothetical protein KDD25_05685 [Bdellovibrionales bacterium]|nr:hypothetical protein [Bdellovibrionales bacterium]
MTQTPQQQTPDLRESRLQAEYNRLCSLYGDALLKLRYWTEQKELIEKQVDLIGKEKQKLDSEKAVKHESENVGDGSPDQSETAAEQ